MMKKLTGLLAMCCALWIFIACDNDSPVAKIPETPEPPYISSNFGVDASTQLLVCWQNDTDIEEQQLQITLKSDADFSNADTITTTGIGAYAVTGKEFHSPKEGFPNTGNYPSRNIFRVQVNGLEPGTEYMYRVGDSTLWSQTRYHTTADNSPTFSFGMFSDPQDGTGLATGLAAALLKSQAYDPNIKFYLMMGDITESIASEKLIKGYFNAAKPYMKQMPISTVQGNHDTRYTDGAIDRFGESYIYNNFFYNTDNGPTERKNATYYYYYNNLLIVMMDTVITAEEQVTQAAWLREVLQADKDAGKSDYIIVGMHKGLFGNQYYNNADINLIKAKYGKILSDFDVDLVVFGHDHTYGRTNPLKIDEAGTVSNFEGSANGTVYTIIGTTGPKYYKTSDTQAKRDQWAVSYPNLTTQSSTEANAGVYVNVKVTDEKMSVVVRNIGGSELDSYEIAKKH